MADQSAAASVDAALVQRMRTGDPDAFADAVALYGDRLFAAAIRILRHEQDARDAVQEAFLGALKSFETFDERARLSTWLTRIVINKCLMKLRSARRRPERSIEDFLPTFAESGHASQPTQAWRSDQVSRREQEELHALVRAKIEELPEQYRLVLILRDVQQLSTEEAAEALGDTPNAVKVRLHRARQALKELLEPMMVESRC